MSAGHARSPGGCRQQHKSQGVRRTRGTGLDSRRPVLHRHSHIMNQTPWIGVSGDMPTGICSQLRCAWIMRCQWKRKRLQLLKLRRQPVSPLTAEKLDTCVCARMTLGCLLRRFGVIMDIIAHLLDRLGQDEEWSFMGWIRALQVQINHSAVPHKLHHVDNRQQLIYVWVVPELSSLHVVLQSPQWLRKMSPRRKQVNRHADAPRARTLPYTFASSLTHH